MIGEVKQVLTKPAKHKKDGSELIHDRYASINLNVPMDTHAQIAAVQKLIEELSDGDYVIEIKPLALQETILDENTDRNAVEDADNTTETEEEENGKPYIPRTLKPQHETITEAKE